MNADIDNANGSLIIDRCYNHHDEGACINVSSSSLNIFSSFLTSLDFLLSATQNLYLIEMDRDDVDWLLPLFDAG